jgi:hypothetical protein
MECVVSCCSVTVTHDQQYGVVLSGHLVVSCEWSIGTSLHYSHLSARLTGHNGAACLHVLHAIIAQAQFPC